MTETATSTEVKNSGAGISPVQPSGMLRLSVCPNCDYSLESLPPVGVCPECGRHYDQEFVILTSADRGTFATAWRSLLWIAFLAMLFIPPIARGGLGRANLWMIVCGLAILLVAGTRVYARLFSSREQRQQLWMSREGVAQFASTPEGRFAAKVARYTIIPMCSITLALLWTSVPQPPAMLAMEMGIIVLANLVVLFQWRDDRSALMHDNIPTLRPWTTVETIEIDELLSGRHRVVLKKFGTVWVSHSAAKIVDIELPFDGRQIAQLRQLIETWTEGRLRCTVNDRSPAKEQP